MAKSRQVLHAFHPGQGGEHTVCGFAFDAFDSGDADDPVVFAAEDQAITCPECCEIIRAYKATKWRLKP